MVGMRTIMMMRTINSRAREMKKMGMMMIIYYESSAVIIISISQYIHSVRSHENLHLFEKPLIDMWNIF